MSQRRYTFTPDALDEFCEWPRKDKKTAVRLKKLLDECARTPFDGTGKPEPLKGDLAGCWSRRITDSDRLVYEVTDEQIVIYSCMGHYGDK